MRLAGAVVALSWTILVREAGCGLKIGTAKQAASPPLPFPLCSAAGGGALAYRLPSPVPGAARGGKLFGITCRVQTGTKPIPGDKAGALARDHERDEAAFQNALPSPRLLRLPQPSPSPHSETEGKRGGGWVSAAGTAERRDLPVLEEQQNCFVPQRSKYCGQFALKSVTCLEQPVGATAATRGPVSLPHRCLSSPTPRWARRPPHPASRDGCPEDTTPFPRLLFPDPPAAGRWEGPGHAVTPSREEGRGGGRGAGGGTGGFTAWELRSHALFSTSVSLKDITV